MYQVSERVKKQFEYTMSIPCVKEAMKFIQEDERNTIEEQKELVLIEAPTGEEEKRAAVFAGRCAFASGTADTPALHSLRRNATICSSKPPPPDVLPANMRKKAFL